MAWTADITSMATMPGATIIATTPMTNGIRHTAIAAITAAIAAHAGIPAGHPTTAITAGMTTGDIKLWPSSWRYAVPSPADPVCRRVGLRIVCSCAGQGRIRPLGPPGDRRDPDSPRQPGGQLPVSQYPHQLHQFGQHRQVPQ